MIGSCSSSGDGDGDVDGDGDGDGVDGGLCVMVVAVVVVVEEEEVVVVVVVAMMDICLAIFSSCHPILIRQTVARLIGRQTKKWSVFSAAPLRCVGSMPGWAASLP